MNFTRSASATRATWRRQTAKALAAGLVWAALPAGAQSFVLEGSVLSAGGGSSSGGEFAVVGTIAQPGAGFFSGDDHAIQGGFWGFARAIQTPGAPFLAVRRVGGNVEISWPADAAGFSLETTGNLNAPGSWSGAAQIPDIADGRSLVLLPIQPGQRFFRLRKP